MKPVCKICLNEKHKRMFDMKKLRILKIRCQCSPVLLRHAPCRGCYDTRVKHLLACEKLKLKIYEHEIPEGCIECTRCNGWGFIPIGPDRTDTCGMCMANGYIHELNEEPTEDRVRDLLRTVTLQRG